MSASEPLYDQAKKLFDEKKYADVIALLSDELLDREKSAPLCTLRAWAHARLNDADAAFIYCHKALLIDPFYGLAYRVRGLAWYLKKEYDKAITDYTKAIELDPADAKAYYNRGLAWYNKKEYDKAITDYTKAIELDPTDAVAYNTRGLAWLAKNEYDKAITDYIKAIDLDPSDATAHYNRGLAWSKKKEYDKTIADYTKAIELDPAYAPAYNNRGAARYIKKEYDKALEDYNRAIELESDPDKISSRIYWRDLALEKLREQLKIGSTRSNKKLVPLVKQLDDAVLTILKEVIYDDEETSAHYTKLSVAENILKNGGGMRYYNAIYMNDPEEGELMFDCFSKSNREKMKTAFNEGKQTQEMSVYLGSFLTNRAPDRHEDELVMWRTYGKDEELTEGAGCSLIIDKQFFDKHDAEKVMSQTSDRMAGREIDAPLQGLYKVIYYKAGVYADGQDKIKEAMASLENIVMEIIKLQVKSKSKEDKKVIDGILFDRLSRISYLFKSSDYAFEHEVRVIQHMPRGSGLIQVDESKKPPKLYIASNKPLLPHLKKIFIGPKVENAEHWMTYLDFRIRQSSRNEKDKPKDSTDYEVEVRRSICKYR